jgi:hypothetical protein
LKLGEPEAHLLGAYGIFLFLVIASKPAIAQAQVRNIYLICDASCDAKALYRRCSDFQFLSAPDDVCQGVQAPAYARREGAILSAATLFSLNPPI